MSILLVGLNHNTAPISLRERLALDPCGLRMALEEFHRTYIEPYENTSGLQHHSHNSAQRMLSECCIISTCNRFEMYAVMPDTSGLTSEQGWETLLQFIARLQDLSVEELRPHLYLHADHSAVRHLMQVAAGIDSLVLGEPQILGQVNRAYKEATLTDTAGPLLSHLFMAAIGAGKRARNETSISRHTTSISHAAANLAHQTLGDLSRLRVLVVGAGEMARLAGEAITMHGAQYVTVINRTYSSAERLAANIDGEAVVWTHLHEQLTRVDLVLSATGAPHTVIHREEVAAAMAERNGRPLAFFDVALPRDVEAAVAELPGVRCYSVDDLQAVVDENMAQRRAEIPAVEAVIAEEAAYFHEWLLERSVVPVLVAMREEARSVAAAEVAESMRRVHRVAPDESEALERVLERMAHRLVNKLLHQPTVRLKEHAAEGDGYFYAHAVRDLLALDPQRLLPAPTAEPAIEMPEKIVDSCTSCTACTTWSDHRPHHEPHHEPHPDKVVRSIYKFATTTPCATRNGLHPLLTLAQEAVYGD